MSGAARTDRAAGVLLASACGDALGVPYEFAARLGPDDLPRMRGGGLGPYAPGEYSDDTQMAVCVAQVASSGADLTSDDALDGIADGFLRWRAEGASDVGAQTSAVLGAAAGRNGRAGRRLRDAAAEYSRTHPRSAGNGALMRTAVVGLTRLDDRDATAAAARAVAELTHADPLAGDACVLWSEAVRVAVRDRRLDLAAGLDLVPPTRRDAWAAWIAEADGSPAASFTPNGFTVTALQAAWAAIVSTLVPDDDPDLGVFACQHLVHALRAAVRVGDDTDTIAAIAGGLLGAYWGGSAVPAAWRTAVHGWPDVRARELVTLGVLTSSGGRSDDLGWPAGDVVVDPAAREVCVDAGGAHRLWLGTSTTPTDGFDAVVSLCRVGAAASRSGPPRFEVHLIDSDDPADNPHLGFALDDTAAWIHDRLGATPRILVHCVAAEARTPAVAIASGLTTPDAVLAALPHARGAGLLWDVATRPPAEADADPDAVAALSLDPVASRRGRHTRLGLRPSGRGVVPRRAHHRARPRPGRGGHPSTVVPGALAECSSRRRLVARRRPGLDLPRRASRAGAVSRELKSSCGPGVRVSERARVGHDVAGSPPDRSRPLRLARHVRVRGPPAPPDGSAARNP